MFWIITFNEIKQDLHNKYFHICKIILKVGEGINFDSWYMYFFFKKEKLLMALYLAVQVSTFDFILSAWFVVKCCTIERLKRRPLHYIHIAVVFTWQKCEKESRYVDNSNLFCKHCLWEFVQRTFSLPLGFHLPH